MIEMKDVKVTFNPSTALETLALAGINFEVPDKQFVTVIGTNGAGKSTMLNVLSGLIPVSAGSVSIDDCDVTKYSVARRAKSISRVFQDPASNTCRNLTISENFALAYGRATHKGFRFALNRRMREQIANRVKLLGMGLEDRLDEKMGSLSGGQRQGVSLLMATAGETKALLLDEHTAALDPKAAEFVMDLTRRVVSELGVTTVMVTHSMEQAISAGTRTVMFHEGNIAYDISGDERNAMTAEDLVDLFNKKELYG